jgi:SMP-30/Gluconolactonase/LRE-like region
MPRRILALVPAPLLALLAACASAPAVPPVTEPTRLATVDGFVQPEAVRYDPQQDVYFVANFGEGAPGVRDTNGFISRMRPDGTIESLRWIAGKSNGVTLHAPLGMTIVGDTLWVVDAGAVRGFDRRTGAPLRTVDLTGLDVGFLNDIAAGPDGTLYVTDTPKDRVYRVRGDAAIAIGDSALGRPNGITWDAAGRRFIVVSYGGTHAIRSWTPEAANLTEIGTSSAGARFDGVEVLPGGRVLVASQADSSLHLFENGTGRAIAKISGPPADIAVDTRRNRVAVPIIRLNRVELWQLP